MHVKNPKILLFAVPVIFYWMHNIINIAKKGLIDDNIIKYTILNFKSAFLITVAFSIMLASQI